MDYSELKQHEISFVQEMEKKKNEKKEKMKEELKRLEAEYKISFKSKVHDKQVKEFSKDRHQHD